MKGTEILPKIPLRFLYTVYQHQQIKFFLKAPNIKPLFPSNQKIRFCTDLLPPNFSGVLHTMLKFKCVTHHVQKAGGAPLASSGYFHRVAKNTPQLGITAKAI